MSLRTNITHKSSSKTKARLIRDAKVSSAKDTSYATTVGLIAPAGISQEEWERRLGVSDEGVITILGNDPETEVAARVASELIKAAENGEIDVTQAEDIDEDFEPDAADEAAAKSTTLPPEQQQQELTPEQIEKKRKHRKSILIGVCTAALVCACAIYAYGFNYYSTHFLPHTLIAGVDVSNMTTQEAKSALDTAVCEYSFSISGYEFEYQIAGADIGFTFDAEAAVTEAQSLINAPSWFLSLVGTKREIYPTYGSCDESILNKRLKVAISNHNEDCAAPSNAKLAWDAQNQKVYVADAAYGTQVDAEAIYAAAYEAIAVMSHIQVTEDMLVKPTVFADDASLQALAQAVNASGFTMPDVSFTINSVEAFKVDPSVVAYWLDFSVDGSASVNQTRLKSWVYETASDYSTKGNRRTWVRSDGKECAVSGGVYGITIDASELLTLVKTVVEQAQVGSVEVPYSGNIDSYLGPGARDWGKCYIDVDITEQYCRYYNEDGELVWESSCVTGAPSRETTTGVWQIITYASPATLVGADYVTQVSYWMKFTANGIGLHDATWQDEFGGTRYLDGWGSHGCVNLPLDKAKELYGLVGLGTIVVTHY